MRRLQFDTNKLYDDLFDYRIKLQQETRYHITQEAFGEHFGLSGEAIRMFFSKRRISWNTLAVICLKMGKPMEDYLI